MILAPALPPKAQQDVPLDQVKNALHIMWNELNDSSRSQTQNDVLRSSVMTLVAYAPSADQARWLSDAIANLTGQHPSRAIILSMEPESRAAVPTATVSLVGHRLPNTNALVGSEQIILHIPGPPSRRIASLVLPLLLSDMPIFVWWSGGLPPRDDVVLSLVELGDYSLFDSADFEMPEDDLVRLADLIQKRRRNLVNHAGFNDFNWTRVKPWRELTAQCFDPLPRRAFLNGIDRVTIEYARDGDACPQQAYLFAGWLASRLSWRLLGSHRRANGRVIADFISTQSMGRIAVEIAPRGGLKTEDWRSISSVAIDMQDAQTPPMLSLGALTHVEITSRLDQRQATFTIHRDEDLKHARTTAAISDQHNPEQRYAPLESLNAEELLHEQLTIFNYDHIYEDAVLAAKEVVQPLGSDRG